MNLFGTALMWATPLTNAAGAAVAVPTALLFGTMQECEIEIKRDLKQLHGQGNFPVKVAGGKSSINGKAKSADIFGAMLETIAFGQAGSAGIQSAVYDTAGVTVATTVTPTVPNSGAWLKDLSVIDASTGRPYTRVASAPAAGQYSVAAGVYTFAAGDVGKTAYISYGYTATSTVARKGTVTNQPMGQVPTFAVDLYVPYDGKYMVWTFPRSITDGIKFGFKNDDFTVPEFGFQCFADTAGNVATWSLSE
jgi:hypothetical protein